MSAVNTQTFHDDIEGSEKSIVFSVWVSNDVLWPNLRFGTSVKTVGSLVQRIASSTSQSVECFYPALIREASRNLADLYKV